MIGWIETPYAAGDGTINTLFRIQVEVIDYDLPIEAAQAISGSVTIKGKIRDVSFCILSLADFPQYNFKITSQSICDKGTTKLSVEDSASVCDGMMLVTNSNFDKLDTYFARVCAALSNNAVYPTALTMAAGRYTPPQQLPEEIEIYNVTATQTQLRIKNEAIRNKLSSVSFSSIKETIYCDEADLPSMTKLIRYLRSIGFNIHVTLKQMVTMQKDATPKGTAVIKFVSVYDENVPTPIAFDDGHTELLSESYNDDVCSCVYVVYAKPLTGTNAEKFTLTMEGDIVSGTDVENQMIGYFHPIKKSGTYSHSAAIKIAQGIFAENKIAHKIEFASDKEFHVGQPVRMVLERGILDTAISKVVIKSGDSRYYYTCGELPTTATDRIATNGWKYGTRRPANPKKGELYITP